MCPRRACRTGSNEPESKDRPSSTVRATAVTGSTRGAGGRFGGCRLCRSPRHHGRVRRLGCGRSPSAIGTVPDGPIRTTRRTFSTTRPLESASRSLIAPLHNTPTPTLSPCAPLSLRPERPSPLELRRPFRSRHARSPSVNESRSAAVSDMSGFRRKIAPLVAFFAPRIAPLVA